MTPSERREVLRVLRAMRETVEREGCSVLDAWRRCVAYVRDDATWDTWDALVAHIRKSHPRCLCDHDRIPVAHSLLWLDYAIAWQERALKGGA